MKDVGEFGRLENAMLYQALPRVRGSDSSSSDRDSDPAVDPRTTTKKSKAWSEASETTQPSMPELSMFDSVPSVRISKAPQPKFRLVALRADDDGDEEDCLADHDVIEYASEPPFRAGEKAQIDSLIKTQQPTVKILREGASLSRGLGRSSIVFLAVIAIAIITVSLVALVVLEPAGGAPHHPSTAAKASIQG